MDLVLNLDPDSATPLYLQVVEQVREAILTGRLAAGTRLPSTRELAVAHGIARNTVALAYEQLAGEGYLEGRERSGHYVSLEMPDSSFLAVPGTSGRLSGPAVPAAPDGLAGGPDAGRRGVRLSGWAQAVSGVALPHTVEQGLPYDFRQRFPGADTFPTEEWRRCLLEAIDSGPELLEYGDPAGYGPLREAVAA